MERHLPEWMTKTKVKETSDRKSSSATSSIAMVSGKVCDRRMAYLMSPLELQMIAKDILGFK
jgi:hypothetical protein